MTDADAGPDRSKRGIANSGYDLPWLAEIGALLLRVYFGFTIFFRAGLSKFPLDQWFAGQVADLGFPLPTLFAWSAAMAEVAGGVLLMIGLCTRFASFFLAFTLGVAAFQFHKLGITDQHITLLYFWVYVFFTAAGAGQLSIDGMLGSRSREAAIGGLAVLIGLSVYCATLSAPEPDAGQDQPVGFSEVSTVHVAGSFNEWSLSATPMSIGDGGQWSCTIEVDSAQAIELKFVGNETWDLAAGETDQSDGRFPISGAAEIGQNAANILGYLPRAGVYELRLKLPELTYSLTAQQEPTEAEANGPSDGEAEESVEE